MDYRAVKNEGSEYCAKYILAPRQSDSNKVLRKVIVLDRDGVLNFDFGYVNSIERLKFREDVIERVQELDSIGHRLAIATNQSGVARGKFSEEDLVSFNLKLLQLLKLNYGISFECLVYCPNHPNYGYICSCRKPAPGLLNWICDYCNVDRNQVLFVGDKKSDADCALAANIDFVNVEKFLASA